MLVRYLVSNYLRTSAGKMVRGKVEDMVTDQARSLQQAGQERELPECQIAIVFASHVEATGVLDQMSDVVSMQCASFVEHAGTWNDLSIVVIEAGDRWRDIARATTELINLHHPRWIVSAGFCCGLHPRYRQGGIVMPTRISDTTGRQLEVGFKISEKAVKETKGLFVGEFLTVSEMLDTPEKRKALHQKTGAVVADMESSVIAEICRQAAVRCMSVRVITEGIEDQPPALLSRIMKHKSKAGKLGVLSKGMLTELSSVKELWDLKNQAYQSAERLALFLEGVLMQLADTDD